MATHLLVGNPTAQSGRNAERIAQARQLLAAKGVTTDLVPTRSGGETVGAVREALDAGSHRVVIAMGGDGTFREVGAGLLASARRREVAMGMIPTGTANDQGRSFGLEAGEGSLARNVEVIADGYETTLDAGHLTAREADGRAMEHAVFFDSAGWGISARVLARRNRDREVVAALGPLKEIYRDQLVYAGAALRTFLEAYVIPDKFGCSLRADGVEHELEGLTDLVVKATRIYGGMWVFDRTSRHDDGAFEVVPFRGRRDWTSKALVDLDGNPITEEVLNAVGIEHSHPIRASRIELRLTVPAGHADLCAQIDGEEFLSTPVVDIVVERSALRLIVPRP